MADSLTRCTFSFFTRSDMKTAGVLLAGATLLVVLVIVLRMTGLETAVMGFLAHVERSGLTGQWIFAMVVASSVVFMLPSVVFTVGAGYLFGVVHGAILVVVSETIGATVAFLIARYVLGDSAKLWLQNQAKVAHVSKSLFAHGWKVIAAFRMIPFFPFKLSNYFFGLLPMTLNNYLLGTFVGLWPITLFNVYIGSTASSLMTLESDQQVVSTQQWIGYLAGLLMGIAAIVYLSQLARKTLTQY